MPKVKQPNSSKVRNILHEYASEFTSTPKAAALASKFKNQPLYVTYWYILLVFRSLLFFCVFFGVFF